jgi:hypothetical protein
MYTGSISGSDLKEFDFCCVECGQFWLESVKERDCWDVRVIRRELILKSSPI